ncbi:NAD-dependent protein deacetylase [Actinoallomurus oryzae]|uniref:NAD-dependent protein deacetylase n=2 Tax=Actinoallomurus oryzae TaxID=502180 RepID=A0ABP8PJW5_9ACTN
MLGECPGDTSPAAVTRPDADAAGTRPDADAGLTRPDPGTAITPPDTDTAPTRPDAGAALTRLADLIADGDVVVLSGAGLSTESGIPDYRGETGRKRRAEPMTYQTFVGSAAARRRYWARSHLGWRHVARATPNAGHRAVAELQRRGLVRGIITQNVDGLQQAAGAHDVIELHGSLDRVMCLNCGRRTSREVLDERLSAANRAWSAEAGAINPDGDAVLEDEDVASFRVVDCVDCGGLLKPDVIFFGENVPRSRVDECYGLTERAGLLLVLGSSLTVLSGYRFVRHAARLGIPVAIVNQGGTRGDEHALVTFDAPLGPTLTALLRELGDGSYATR